MYQTTVAAGRVGAGAVAAVWLDPELVRFALHPGTTEPGGSWPTPSVVTADERPALLAAFNSAFKIKDSHGGFYLDGQGASTLRAGAATFTIDSTGHLDVGTWGRDGHFSDTLVAARQNLTLLVDGGQPTATVADTYQWGGIFGLGPGTWRSGVGVTRTGAVLYLSGPSLTAADLAAGFVAVGAVRAMELDINHAWVTFNTYQTIDGHTSGTKLLATMNAIGDRYLTPDQRDFVTVLDRSTPPGAAGQTV